MKKILVVLLTTLLAAMFALPVIGVAETETIDGVEYTYSVTDGKATITNAEFNPGEEIVIPSTLDGMPVTAIEDSAFENVASSITLPATLKELRGDEFNYSEDENGLETLIIPGRGTLVYPAAVHELRESGGTVKSFEGSAAWFFARWYDVSFEKTQGTLKKAPTIQFDKNIKRGWEIGITGSIEEDYYYPMFADGLKFTLSDAKQGDSWVAWDVNGDPSAPYTGTVGEGGVCVFQPESMMEGENGRFEMIFAYGNEKNGWTKVCVNEPNSDYPYGWGIQFLAEESLAPSTLTLPTNVTANGEDAFIISWSAVEGAEAYQLGIKREFSDPTDMYNRIILHYVDLDDIASTAQGIEIDSENVCWRVIGSEDWDDDDFIGRLPAGKATVTLTAVSSTKNASRTTAVLKVGEPEAGREFEAWSEGEQDEMMGIHAVYASGDVTIPETIDDSPVILSSEALKFSGVTSLRISGGVNAAYGAFDSAWSLKHIWLPFDMSGDWPEDWEALGFAEGQAITWHAYEGTEAYEYASEMVSQANNGSELICIPKTKLTKPALTLAPKSVESGADDATVNVSFSIDALATDYEVELTGAEGTVITPAPEAVVSEGTGTVEIDAKEFAVGRYIVSVTAKAAQEGIYSDSDTATAEFSVTEKVEDGSGNTYSTTGNDPEETTVEVTITGLSDGAIEEGTGNLTIQGTFTKEVAGTETTYTVTEIGSGLLENNEAIKTVILPETVTSIGENAFAGSAVETVNLEGTNTVSIGDGAFRCAENLKELTLPETTTTIGAQAFAGIGTNAENGGIQEIILPANVESLGDGVFNGANIGTVTVAGKELAVTSVAAFNGISDETTFAAPAGSLAEYFYNSYQQSQDADLVAVPVPGCVLPPAVEATFNTEGGQISTSDEAILTIDGVSPDADYVVIVEDSEGIEVLERRNGNLSSRMVSSLSVSLGVRTAGSYTVRYTVNEKNGEGWTRLAKKELLVSNDEPDEAGSLKYLMDDGGLTIVGTTGMGTTFEIPEREVIDGRELPVIAVAANAFRGENLSITIPNMVIRIERNAIPTGTKVKTPENSPAWFYGKKNGWSLTKDSTVKVKTMTLPASLTTLSANALVNTDAECVILPAGCQVKAGAFAGCGSLKVIAFRGTAGVLTSIFGEGGSEGVLLVNAGMQAGAYPDAETLNDVDF